MTAAWPATLPPAPLVGTWSETPQRNVATFQPEVGPPKYRRRNTANGTTAQATFLLDDTQYGILQDFYANDLMDGSLPFSWDHPVTGISYSWTFVDDPQYDSDTAFITRVSVKLTRLP